MISKRERALGAAVDLLGTEGLRALTHVRVDERAELPRGSTSNYFRTRAALLDGVVDWMVRQETPSVGAALDVATPDELVEAVARLFEFMLGPNRVVTTARMVLRLEASHDPALRQALARGGAAMTDLVVPVLTRLGASDPQVAAAALGACGQGFFVQAIAGGTTPDPRPVLEVIVRGALA
ncbi:TetR/AcrR family transcriptional regulator [Amycolatopsis xylanica]|uniref:TetR/AcrR family transcriptional regulator n=1 Tax=Amycolatopsis xylanica TaxID=589385 RepID=UPI000B871798|nr:TetR/AcrR family transcriptional regulator [Amycolatopsis xylanica]